MDDIDRCRIERMMDAQAPCVLPHPWALHEEYSNARIYVRPGAVRLSVIAEIDRYENEHWLHVSCSAGTRMATWEELREVKDLFCGVNAVALQVLPPANEYVNVDPNVLHLWVCLERRPVPDFRKKGMI